MIFNPKDFKALPGNFGEFDRNMRDMPVSPLILIKANGEISYGGQHKDDVVDSYDEVAGDILLFAWSGQWRTDVFIVTADNLKKFYHKPAPKIKTATIKKKK